MTDDIHQVTAPLDCLRDTLSRDGHAHVELLHHFGTEIHRFPPNPSSHTLEGSKVRLEFLKGGQPVTTTEVDLPFLDRSAPLPGEEKGEKVDFDTVKAQFQLKSSDAATYRLGLIAFGSLKVQVVRDGKQTDEWDYQGEKSFFDYVLNPARVWEPRLFEMGQDEAVTIQLGEFSRPLITKFRGQISQDPPSYPPTEYKREAFSMPGISPEEAYAARAFGFHVGFEQQIDDEAALKEASELAAKCDLAIIMTATGKEFESEGFDRETLKLPRRQDDLVKAVAMVQKKTVVLNQTGSVVEMPWIDDVKGIIQAWFGGQETGWAICDVLLGHGRAPASGRFAQTWGG